MHLVSAAVARDGAAPGLCADVRRDDAGVLREVRPILSSGDEGGTKPTIFGRRAAGAREDSARALRARAHGAKKRILNWALGAAKCRTSPLEGKSPSTQLTDGCRSDPGEQPMFSIPFGARSAGIFREVIYSFLMLRLTFSHWRKQWQTPVGCDWRLADKLVFCEDSRGVWRAG